MYYENRKYKICRSPCRIIGDGENIYRILEISFISAYMCPHYTFTLSPRYECGVPVIIEGETGVGKTALVEMLSKLWNQSLLCQWKRQKDRILDFMRRKLGDLTADESSDEYMVLTNQKIPFSVLCEGTTYPFCIHSTFFGPFLFG